MNHVWGLFAHPNREMSVIKSENETISHHYTHHVLLMAAVPVVCAFIGTTQLGWNFGDGTIIKLSMWTGLALAVLFYAVMLAGVAIMGRVIWWMARQYPQQPSLKRCMVFAGYVATPLFLSGIVALYPLVWLCALIGTVALFYTGYLLYLGIPTFLSINREEGLSFASSTLAIGGWCWKYCWRSPWCYGGMATDCSDRTKRVNMHCRQICILCRQCSISSRFLLGTGPYGAV